MNEARMNDTLREFLCEHRKEIEEIQADYTKVETLVGMLVAERTARKVYAYTLEIREGIRKLKESEETTGMPVEVKHSLQSDNFLSAVLAKCGVELGSRMENLANRNFWEEEGNAWAVKWLIIFSKNILGLK